MPRHMRAVCVATVLSAFAAHPAWAKEKPQPSRPQAEAPRVPDSEASPAPPPQSPPPPTAPPEELAAQPDESAVPPGQWVHTAQYGWLWMPYGSVFTYVPYDGTEPFMYVFYPAVGWTWVVAPWVWGWGPPVYFGSHGPWRFGWHRGGPYWNRHWAPHWHQGWRSYRWSPYRPPPPGGRPAPPRPAPPDGSPAPRRR